MVDVPDFQTTEEGREYEKNVMMVLQGEKKDYPSYFGGMKVASGVEFSVYSPIDESIQFGIFQEPEEHIMVEAVTAAVKALETWRYVSPEERASYFEKALANIKARRQFFAAAVTVASGMVREDALGEVDRLIEIIEKAVADAKTLGRKQPVGVWAVLSAHNSPFASPVGHAVAAMIAGNTVVMNPSNTCPTPVYMFYELMDRYGLPGGVLNLVVDRAESASTEELANDMRVTGVVACGSGERLEDLMFLQVDDELKFINEIKGMNPAIVYRPSDMKATVKNILESAFYHCGQGLFSCSKVIITPDDQKKFTMALQEALKDMRLGDPVNDTTFVGPLINKAAAKKFKDLVQENYGYVIMKAAPVMDAPGDNYVSPVVMMGLEEDNDLNYMDTGLPILTVKVVDTIDDAFLELEDTECGLSAGLFAKDANVIGRFKAEADAPQLYINTSSRSLKVAREAELSNFVM